MGQKEQEALAFIKVMVKHQKAVFTRNPRFAQTVTNAFEDIREYHIAKHGHAAIVQQLADAKLDVKMAPQAPTPAYRVAWNSYPELRVSRAAPSTGHVFVLLLKGVAQLSASIQMAAVTSACHQCRGYQTCFELL